MTPYQTACQHDALVAAFHQAGGSLEDCIVALVERHARLMERLMELEGIAPKRYQLPDGRILEWRCPGDLVPIEKMLPAP